jgi:hypothetical protein
MTRDRTVALLAGRGVEAALMDRSGADWLEPVEGKIIRRTYLKSRIWLAALSLVALTGCVVTILWWRFTAPGELGISPKVAVLGAVAALGSVGIGWLIVNDMAHKNRLLLATDRLQFLERDKEVVRQIPYANIAKIRLCKPPRGREFIGIDFRDADDDETYLGNQSAKRCRRAFGFDYRITGGLEKRLADVHTLILDHIRDFNLERHDPMAQQAKEPPATQG